MGLVSFDQGAIRGENPPRWQPICQAGELHGMKGQGHQEMEDWWRPARCPSRNSLENLDEHKKEKKLETGELKKMTLEKWKQHVGRGHTPFNRRCCICMQEAGVDRPHRRLKADIPSYVVNVDIAGPFSTGEDVGTGRKVKYVPIPVGAGPSEAAEPEEEDPNPADWEEEDDQPRASDEEARRLNDKVKDEMADAMKGVTVQNVRWRRLRNQGAPERSSGPLAHALRSGEGVPGKAGAAVVFRAQSVAHHDGGR